MFVFTNFIIIFRATPAYSTLYKVSIDIMYAYLFPFTSCRQTVHFSLLHAIVHTIAGADYFTVQLT